MPSKLTAQERLRLIKRVTEGGEKVARVCREAGISRVLFYRWLSRYEKAAGEKKKAVLKPRKKGEPLKFKLKPPGLSAQERLQMIERVKSGESIVKACQNLGVSRTIFYRWLKRYRAAPEGQKLEALWDKKPKVEKYWRQTPEKYENVVLNLVIEHPELSTHKIVEFLPQIGGRPILGNHGVQNVLRRHNLTNYAQRFAYSQALRHAPQTLDRAIHAFQNLLTSLYALPVPNRQLVVRLGASFLAGAFVFILFLGARSYFSAFTQATLGSKFGLTFATLSLAVGTVFFLYSLKYYFTLTLVLGFSRQVSSFDSAQDKGPRINGDGNQESPLGGRTSLKTMPLRDSTSFGNGNGRESFWQRIFGVKTNGNGHGSGNDYQNGNGNGPSTGSGQRVLAGGLQANLDHVKLARHPFVSIHLPLYNEKRVVDRLLTATTSQNYENYEVIVVDDSTDETCELLEKWKSHPRVKIIHRDSREGFKGGALREALRASSSKTEFVLVFDADFLPYPDTITQFLKYFQATAGTLDFKSRNPKSEIPNLKQIQNSNDKNTKQFGAWNLELDHSQRIAAIQGYQWHVLNKSENWITRGVRSEYAGSYVIERSGEEALGALKQIAGSVYMIRRDILERYGWGTSLTEDFELTLKLYRDGFKVVYTPYIQTPSECVSTLKRLIRQRMRWAEGHSHNIRRMFGQLMWGRWEETSSTSEVGGAPLQRGDTSEVSLTGHPAGGVAPAAHHLRGGEGKVWIPSKLTLMEKLEFLYLSPYYLQAALFIVGTFSWLLAEAVFRTRLPFWTSLWGWSLVLTNLFALPLMNTVGLFLEESEERDYMGVLSFLTLSYLLAPFQGYAAVKGFLERQEGPWFRTPKTGLITDIFTPGRFARFISGIFGRPAVVPAVSQITTDISPSTTSGYGAGADQRRFFNQPLSAYVALATANSQFNNFAIRPKRLRWVSKAVLAILLIISSTIFSLTRGVPEVLATPISGIFNLDSVDSTLLSGTNWKLLDNTNGTDATTTIISLDGQTGPTGRSQYYPGTNRNPPTVESSACGDGVADGNGWIFETPFQSGGQITNGTWTFYVNETDNRKQMAGTLEVCVYKITISGASISLSTLLFSQTDTTDVWDVATNNFSFTSSQGQHNIGANEYLYVEYFLNTTATGGGPGTVTSTFGVGPSNNNARITTPSVTIPENVVFFLAAAPFIPMIVIWMKRKRIALSVERRALREVN